MVAASRVAKLVTGPTGRPLPVFPQPEPLTRHGPARGMNPGKGTDAPGER